MLRSLFAVLGGAGLLFAQGYTSPAASTSVTIDGKAIRIDYHAPSMHGRKIFGGLVPYGKVWRAGANQATAFHTDAEIDLGGLKIPKGDYTLFVYPESKQWKLIINKQAGQWGLEYHEDRDLARVAMNMSTTSAPVETWKITLSQAGPHEGKLRMEWENTVAELPFTVH
ncbi:MAG: DUF2911 domain-containing protein [Bryobacteraceae bacterium]